jgi:hypothetical protein
MTNGSGTGYYYWDGTNWLPIVMNSSNSGGVCLPTEVSNRRWTNVNWTTCLANCGAYAGTTAGDGNFTDWRMPTLMEFQYAIESLAAPTGGWINQSYWTKDAYYPSINHYITFMEGTGDWNEAVITLAGGEECRCIR